MYKINKGIRVRVTFETVTRTPVWDGELAASVQHPLTQFRSMLVPVESLEVLEGPENDLLGTIREGQFSDGALIRAVKIRNTPSPCPWRRIGDGGPVRFKDDEVRDWKIVGGLYG